MPRPKNIIAATDFSEKANRAGGNDLIVIGKHGGEVIDELLLGSVTQNILYHADCDVLLSA